MNKEIDYIVAAAECGSISKAAEILYISQPSLSRYISKLENELGLSLFVRSIDGITLTKAGEVYVEHAKEIRKIQSTLERRMYQMKKENSNHICVCMTLNSSVLSTWRIIDDFRKKYPDNTLEFINVMSRDIPSMLETKKCNFAIGPDVGDHSLYRYEEIAREHIVLIVPAERYNFDQLAETREGFAFPWISLKKIPKVDFVFQERSCNIRGHIERMMEEQEVHFKPRMEFTNSILTIQAAEQQLGCCFISEAFFPYITQRNQMRYYYVQGEQMFSVSGVIYEKNRRLTKSEKYCIQYIKKLLTESLHKFRDEFSNIMKEEKTNEKGV